MKLKILIAVIFYNFVSITCEINYECKENIQLMDKTTCEVNKFEPGRNSYKFFSNKNPKFIKKVYFKQSRHSEIPSSIFCSFKNLSELILNDTGIDHIDPINIGDASSLLSLHLSSNKIKELKNDAFVDAPNLKSLYLTKNHIKVVELCSFKGLGELRVLALNENKIESLDRDTFTFNSKLYRIDLSNNMLKEVDSLLFYPCKELKELIISRNQLVSLRLVFEYNFLMKLIANQNKIVTLSLDAEKISQSQNTSIVIQAIENYIEKFFVSEKYTVTALHLYKNKLKDFKPIWKLNSLKSLSLSSNSIGYVDHSSFANMVELEDLYLSRTDLFFSDPDTFSSMKKLKKLDIGYNKLKFIDFIDFSPLVSLEDLAIHFNDFTDINVYSLKSSLPQLKRIFISGNDFLCDVVSRIVENLERANIQPTGDFKTLTKIDASQIDCIPVQNNDAEMVNSREQLLYFEGKISTMIKAMKRRINEKFSDISEKFCHLETLLSQPKGDTRNLKSSESSLCDL